MLSLEHRLTALEDEHELRDLLTRYSWCADLGRIDQYAALFTEDAVLDLRPMGLERYLGRSSIRDDFISSPAATATAGRTLHNQAPTVITIDGDTACGEGYSTVLYVDDGGAISVAGASYNRWSFRREEVWRISSREVQLLGSDEAGFLLADSSGS